MFKKKKLATLLLLLLTNIILPLNVFAYSDYVIAGGQNIGIELDSNGVIIVGTYEVNKENPAKNANLKTGDKIIKINETPVSSIKEMINAIDDTRNDTVTISYLRANKEYQTQLLNAIKIPLMVYSGRIIQNYPLGLGIRAIIKTNQLVFEAASKSGSDVYNILSTGQLNGLSIALLLSIKNVYGDTKGLDILLIDDPLQTIDDISAISLADLLTQQGIGQIVLSTHEETKAALLRYKFKHAGMSVREQNMQALYMKTVTEE